MQEHHRERQKARSSEQAHGLDGWVGLSAPDLRSVHPRICSSAAAVSLSWRCRSKRSSVGEASPFVPPRGSWRAGGLLVMASVKGRWSHPLPGQPPPIASSGYCGHRDVAQRVREVEPFGYGDAMMITGWAGPNHSRSCPVDLFSSQSTAAQWYCRAAQSWVARKKLDAAALLRRSLALAFGSHPCRFSSGPRASRSYGQRFCDRRTSKQTAGTGRSFGGRDFPLGSPKPTVCGPSTLEVGAIPLISAAERGVRGRPER